MSLAPISASSASAAAVSLLRKALNAPSFSLNSSNSRLLGVAESFISELCDRGNDLGELLYPRPDTGHARSRRRDDQAIHPKVLKLFHAVE